MNVKRRDFINLSILTAGGVVAGISSCNSKEEKEINTTTAKALASMTKDVVPITIEERQTRIAKAQRLMTEQNIQALILDSGTSLKYFTGISWCRVRDPW